jgi:hypothetical protein
MVFLHIDDDTKMDKLNKLNTSIKDDKKHIFLLVFMNGCGPCEATKPHWLKIETSKIGEKFKNNEDVIVADLEQSLLNSLKGLPKQPAGFPSMYYITNGGKTCEDFDNRDIDSFIKWIESKTENKKGGSKRTKTMKKNKKHNKKSNKSKKSKKSKKRTQHSSKRNKK